MLYISSPEDSTWKKNSACGKLDLIAAYASGELDPDEWVLKVVEEEFETYREEEVAKAQTPSELLRVPQVIWDLFGSEHERGYAKVNTRAVTRVFFPERGEPSDPSRKVCGACEVRLHCLEFALYNNEKLGTWGGTSERTRRRIRRMRKLAKNDPTQII